MAQSGFTPISIYYSTTASAVPTAANLVQGELAINTADGKLYYEDSSGVVQVLATKGGVGTSSNTQVLYNSSGLVVGSAGLTYDGTNLTTTGTATATRFIPSGSTVATNGMYLPSANTLSFSTNSTQRLTITSSGNAGLGTSSPSSANGSDRFLVIAGSASADVVSLVLDPNTGNAHEFQSYNGTLKIFNSTTQQMTLDASGNLLVNVTNTAHTSAGFTIENGGIPYVTRGSGGTFMGFYDTSAAIIGSITSSGGIATLYNTTSDQRLKTNIVDAPSGNIDSIKVRSFDWKSDGSHQEYGMVAQELIEVAPYAVSQPENPNEMMAVDYSKLVPMMIKEIQDLRARLATLENK